MPQYGQENNVQVGIFIAVSILNIIGCVSTFIFFLTYKRRFGYYKLLWPQMVLACCVLSFNKTVLWLTCTVFNSFFKDKEKWPKYISLIGYFDLSFSNASTVQFPHLQIFLYLMQSSKTASPKKTHYVNIMKYSSIFIPLIVFIITSIAAPLTDAFGDNSIGQKYLWFNLPDSLYEDTREAKTMLLKVFFWYQFFNILASLVSIFVWIAAIIRKYKNKKLMIESKRKSEEVKKYLSRGDTNSSFFSSSFEDDDEENLEIRYSNIDSMNNVNKKVTQDKEIIKTIKKNIKNEKKLLKNSLDSVIARSMSFQFINLPLIFILFTICSIVGDFCMEFVNDDIAYTVLWCIIWLISFPYMFPIMFIYPALKTEKLRKKRKINRLKKKIIV